MSSPVHGRPALKSALAHPAYELKDVMPPWKKLAPTAGWDRFFDCQQRNLIPTEECIKESILTENAIYMMNTNYEILFKGMNEKATTRYQISIGNNTVEGKIKKK